MEQKLDEVRIAADVEIVEADDPGAVVRHSAGSSVVGLKASTRPEMRARGPSGSRSNRIGLGTAAVTSGKRIGSASARVLA